MARRKNQRATNHADFAGPDADRDNIERLAKAAQEANAKTGHNSGDPSPEAITRSYNAIKVAKLEILAAGRIMQKARSELSAAEKTVKTDLGSKGWVTSIKKAVQLDLDAAKGGMGEIVTEHRQIGLALRTLEVPLGTQFGLFSVAEIETPPTANGAAPEVSENEAELRGEQDYRAGLKITDNYYMPGTPQHVAWGTGWRNAQKANVAGVGGVAGDGGRSPGDAPSAVN